MHLTHLHIRHFRSLYDVSLALKPLTILIGPNGSGKSNLFKALRFLYDGVAGDRLDWQAYDAQIDHLLWYGLDERGERPDTIALDCRFGSLEASLAEYKAELRGNDYLKITAEELAVALAPREPLRPFFVRREDQFQYLIGRRGAPLKEPRTLQVRSPRTLTLRDEGPDLYLTPARAVYEHVSGWRFFEVVPQRARGESFIPEYPEEVPPLANDAANLSGFLYALSRIRPDDFNGIVETLFDLIGLPQKLLVEHDAERGGQSARYFFYEMPFGEGRPVPPGSVSDGTVRLLAHLALLAGDMTVSLACLEEPDQGLHPRLMMALADVLRQVVTPSDDEGAKTPQVLITTHSPEFMDCFDLEEEQDYLQVYIADRDELGRTVLMAADAEVFAPWLERYRLGEAVRRRLV